MPEYQPPSRSRQRENHIIQEALAILESRQRQPGEQFQSVVAARDFLRIKLSELEREVFALLLLDSQHRLIEYVEPFHGTLDAAQVYPREIVRLVLHHNAAAVILAHNHPSGCAEPSQSDRQITGRIQQALALIDVPVLDHLVVGQPEVTSFAQRGWL